MRRRCCKMQILFQDVRAYKPGKSLPHPLDDQCDKTNLLPQPIGTLARSDAIECCWSRSSALLGQLPQPHCRQLGRGISEVVVEHCWASYQECEVGESGKQQAHGVYSQHDCLTDLSSAAGAIDQSQDLKEGVKFVKQLCGLDFLGAGATTKCGVAGGIASSWTSEEEGIAQCTAKQMDISRRHVKLQEGREMCIGERKEGRSVALLYLGAEGDALDGVVVRPKETKLFRRGSRVRYGRTLP